VQIIAQLQHRSILPVIDFGEQDSVPFIVMAYMDGGTLRDRIKAGPMPLDEVARLVDQIARGLDYAHSSGVIHRDLKPSNVLLDSHRDAYLTDFGIAKVSEATLQITEAGTPVGTVAYMAPETYFDTPPGPPLDIYALGVTLYQMLTGELPFQAQTAAALMMQHVNQPVPDTRAIRPDLPASIQFVVERAMAKAPEARFPTAQHLSAALTEAIRSPDQYPTPIPLSQVKPAPSIHTTLPYTPPDRAAHVEKMPSDPTLTPIPARRRRSRPWLSFLLTVGAIIIGAMALGLLALGGVLGESPLSFGPEPSPIAANTPVPTPIQTTTPPVNPTAALTQTPTLTLIPAAAPIPRGLPGGDPVAANDQWTPSEQAFDGVDMVLVPTGCFMMGSTQEQIEYAISEWGNYAYRGHHDDELPLHEQCIDEPFWFDVTEVTNAQFVAFGGQALDAGRWRQDDRPREMVTWFEATIYCQSRGGRLPTEAEWEYAARGPDGLIFPWGDQLISNNVVYEGNSLGETAAVGSRPGGASWVGALDMSGNVWEWVSSITQMVGKWMAAVTSSVSA
jgi:serine/threonine-protein kinase